MEERLNKELVLAAKGGDNCAIKRKIDAGANVNYKGSSGESALYWACANNHLYTIKLLMEKGADVTVVNCSGATPLYTACARGYLEVVKFLLEEGGAGSTINTPETDDYRKTPLYIASRCGHLKVVQYLLEEGGAQSTINTTDWNGWTPLKHALNESNLSYNSEAKKNKCKAVVDYLKTQGAEE